MSLCILAGGKLTALAVTAFTLSWTHTVEKTRWSEEWRVTDRALVLVSARVEASGAGMEPPPEARFDGSGWSWQPAPAPQRRLLLAGSAAADAWRLCAGGTCIDLGGGDRRPVALAACEATPDATGGHAPDTP